MKLSTSNIAWSNENDEEMYKYISDSKFSGLEIAPTRVLTNNPYDQLDKAKQFKQELKQKYNLEISSMQSIWYGRKENIFNKEEAKELIDYTKKAIDFAREIECKNLVFGCPKNRIIPDDKREDDIIYFFRELGEYAKNNNTTLSIEPNPTIYGTNFINTTEQAFSIVRKINSDGIKVNVDFGTIIENNDSLDTIFKNINLVNHIHIIEHRNEHKKLSEFLKNNNYDKYVSLEMKKTDSIQDTIDCIDYINKIFCN